MLYLLTMTTAFLTVLLGSVGLVLGWNKLGWGIYVVALGVAFLSAFNVHEWPAWICYLSVLLVACASIFLIGGSPATHPFRSSAMRIAQEAIDRARRP